MPSAKLTALADLAGGQVPTDLTYIVDVSAGTAGSKKSTLNDFIATITKNVTDVSLQWQDGQAVATVSTASHGKIRYSQSAVGGAGSFQASEDGGSYQNVIKGPASAVSLTANLFPFATAGDVIGDTALAQLGATTNRTLNYYAVSPGSDLSAYGGIRVAWVDTAGFFSQGFLGILPSILGVKFGGTPASPTALSANSELFRIQMSGQYSTTPGQTSPSCIIQAYATEAWSGSVAGAGMVFLTNPNGRPPGNQFATLAINQLGCVHVRPNLSSGAISSTGTVTLFQIGGGAATIDNNAIAFICDSTNSGSVAVKTLVLQRKALQTGALIQTQSATGVAQFSILPQSGVECHFIDWVGSVNTPAVSAAGSARIYINSSGLFQISENGGAYTGLSSGGMSIGGAVTSGTVGSILFVGTGPVLAQDNANLFWDDSNNRLGIGIGTAPATPIHVLCDASNQGVRVKANAASINVDLTSDGSLGIVGTTTNHAFDLYTNNSTRIRIEAGGSVGINQGGPGAQIHVTSAAAGTIAAIINSAASPSVDILNVRQNATNVLQITSSGALIHTTQARTSGVASYHQIITPADTTLTASTESIGIQFGGNASAAAVTRQWATGALTTQREYVFVAPTYSAVASSTFTTAATVAITGAPTAGTNLSITNPLAFHVQSGDSWFTGATNGDPNVIRINNSDGTPRVQMGTHPTSTTNGAVYFGNVTPASDNYNFLGTGSDVVLNASTSVNLRINHNFTTEAVKITASNVVGVNNNSATAQLHPVSGATSRIAFQAESASGSTVAVSSLIHISDQTAAVRAHTQLYTRSSGAAATGLGGQLLLGLESSTTNDQDAGALNWLWTDATHASRTAAVTIAVVASAAALAEVARFTNAGTALGSTTTTNAQLYVLSGASSRPAARFTSAASPSVDALQVFIDTTQVFGISKDGNVILGNGLTNASPIGTTLQATSGAGSNIAGANTTIAGGQGTGTGAGGSIVFQVAPAGSSGSSLNGLAEAARFLPSLHFRLPELDTDPGISDLSASEEIAIYRKNNKFVTAYNNAGTITYLTIPLDGATTTWTQSTTAP